MPDKRPHIETQSDYQTPEMISYIKDKTAKENTAMAQALASIDENGLPAIQIGALEGRILEFLARSVNTQKAIEIGTLSGYSALWILKGMQKNGRLITLESDPQHAELSEKMFHQAGLGDKVRVLQGKALETLPQIEKDGPFDFCFIDADKLNYPAYIDWAAKILRPGGLVVLDNAYLFGRLHKKEQNSGYEFFDVLTENKYFLSGTMIPTGEGLAVGVRSSQPAS